MRESFLGLTAKTITELEELYKLHSNAIGFCFRKATSRKDHNGVLYEQYLTCSCAGKPKTTTPPTPMLVSDEAESSNANKKKRKRKVFPISKTECKASIRIKLVNGIYIVKHHVVVHNHELNRPAWQQFVRSQRRITPAIAKVILLP